MIDQKRLESFTDAIIAIASTIMVLELKVPKYLSFHTLVAMWPIVLSYIISFFMIYIMWLNHSLLFKKIEKVSFAVFFINGIWILILTLIPFATSLIGNKPDCTLSQVVYACVLFGWEVVDRSMDKQIVKEHPNLEREKRNTLKISLSMYLGFILAIIVAFIKPMLCLAIIVWILLMITIHFFHQRKMLER